MKLLVHGHSFLDFVVLNQNCLSFVELFVKDGKFGLNSEVFDSLLSDQLVQLSKVVSTGHITKGCVASFSNV